VEALAQLLRGAGLALQDRQPDQAEVLRDEALNLLKGLSPPHLRALHASILLDRAQARAAQGGRMPEALADLEAALVAYRQLNQDHPEISDHARGLATAHLALASLKPPPLRSQHEIQALQATLPLMLAAEGPPMLCDQVRFARALGDLTLPVVEPALLRVWTPLSLHH
jgi:hypothetical protein